MSKHGTNCEVALTICVMAYLNDDVTGCKAWGCSHITLKNFCNFKKETIRYFLQNDRFV